MNNSTNGTSSSKFIYVDKMPEEHLDYTEITFVVIASIAVVTSSFNVAVFANPKLKDPTYTFLLVASILDMWRR